MHDLAGCFQCADGVSTFFKIMTGLNPKISPRLAIISLRSFVKKRRIQPCHTMIESDVNIVGHCKY
jgi:hypothetical protein